MNRRRRYGAASDYRTPRTSGPEAAFSRYAAHTLNSLHIAKPPSSRASLPQTRWTLFSWRCSSSVSHEMLNVPKCRQGIREGTHSPGGPDLTVGSTVFELMIGF